MTDMESPRKNNDCYFYYYSTCTKGDNCTFRHEPSALGCETTCSFWKEGKCINVRCNFRHMELRKNRKVIPCYWESQPGGCLKPHCPFLHQNPKHASNSTNQGESSDIKSHDLNKQPVHQNADTCAKNASHSNDKNFNDPVVDPLVVSFEEESDNESVPSQMPVNAFHCVKVKTLEEIKLEKVQEEAAAYYSYPGTQTHENVESIKWRIMSRLKMITDAKNNDAKVHKTHNFHVQCLHEVYNGRKRRFADVDDNSVKNPTKRILLANVRRSSTDLDRVRVKTLEEIRADRAKKLPDQQISVTSSNDFKVMDVDVTDGECEVTSTSRSETDGKKSTDAKLQQRVVLVRPRADFPVHESAEEAGKTSSRREMDSSATQEDISISTGTTRANHAGDDVTMSECEEEHLLLSPKDDSTKTDEGSQSQSPAGTRMKCERFDDVLFLDDEGDDDEFIAGNTLHTEDLLKNIDELLNN